MHASASGPSLPAKLRWVALLYLIEGLPFGLVVYTLPVYFKDHGVSNTEIGLLSLLTGCWSLKILWSPLVDRWPHYRRWIAGCLVALAFLFPVLSLLNPSHLTPLLWGALVVTALVGATCDLAIDAYTIRLVDRGEEGEVNGVRVTAYRIGLIVAGALFLSQKTALGYPALFVLCGGLLLLLSAAVRRLPRTDPRWEEERRSLPAIWAGVWRWLRLPGSVGVLVFILLYNLCDITLAPMVRPFWYDRGYEVEEIAAISFGVGLGVMIAGALLGGWIVSRIGIFHGLWILGLTQGASNLGYWAAAAWGLGRPGMYAASMIESFTDGLGSAALLAFLMRLCEKEWAATQYAVLSAMFALARALFGSPSGWAAERLGYADWFFLTFLLGFPVYAFLPAVRRRLAAVRANGECMADGGARDG